MRRRRLPPWWLVWLLAVMAFSHAAQYCARLFLAYRTSGSVLQAMLASIAVLLSVDLLIAYLPVLGEQRGIPLRDRGLLLAVRAAASVVSRLLMGALVRSLGVGRLLWRSMVVPAVLVGILPFVSGHEMLTAIMILLGIGLGMGQPLSLAWITAIVPPDRRGAAVGLRLSGNRLGQLVAPPALGALGAWRASPRSSSS